MSIFTADAFDNYYGRRVVLQYRFHDCHSSLEASKRMERFRQREPRRVIAAYIAWPVSLGYVVIDDLVRRPLDLRLVLWTGATVASVFLVVIDIRGRMYPETRSRLVIDLTPRQRRVIVVGVIVLVMLCFIAGVVAQLLLFPFLGR